MMPPVGITGMVNFDRLANKDSRKGLRLGPILKRRKGECRSRESADLGFSVHLRKCVPQSNHVTPRRLGGSTARVLATFCDVHFEQKLALLFYPYYCPLTQVF
jgi:hypothetical protein